MAYVASVICPARIKIPFFPGGEALMTALFENLRCTLAVGVVASLIVSLGVATAAAVPQDSNTATDTPAHMHPMPGRAYVYIHVPPSITPHEVRRGSACST